MGHHFPGSPAFFGLVTLFRTTVSEWMGADYAANPDFVVWVAAIIFLDVCTAIPFARLREQGRALTYVGFKAFSVVITVVLAVAFGLAGFYETSFGVGWVFVGNLIASLLTLLAILTTTNRTLPRIDGKLLRRVLVYSLPLMVSGIAGTANEFIYPQMIKYLVPEGAMGEVGIYGAIVKIGMVLMLFVQMYRLAAEPFFLADYKKSDFLQMNAAALKYYVLVSMFIFLGIAFSGIFRTHRRQGFPRRNRHFTGGVGCERPQRRMAQSVVLVQTGGANLAGYRGYLCGPDIYDRMQPFIYSPLGILRSSLGPFSQRSGDGCGKFLAQPPFLSHALPDRTDFGICGVGAGSIRRECRRG